MLAFANHHNASALNLTMSKLITGTLFQSKRLQSTEDGTAPKRLKAGQYVPTIASEDGVSAFESLECFDAVANLEKAKKDKKNMLREKKLPLTSFSLN